MTEAVKGALIGVFFNQGQVCCAGTRLFVEEKLHDEFADARRQGRAAAMKQGPGLEPGTQVGPLVSQEQLERVTGYLDIGKKEGAKALTGGERNTARGLEDGYFVKPTVFTGVRNDMRIAQEEIFGPVVAVIPFKDENDAVLQGNDTLYGLAAGVWTRDVAKAHRVARAIRAGTVWVNCYNVFDVIVAVRRLQAERLRPRAGPPRARPVHAGEERLDAGSERRVSTLRDAAHPRRRAASRG